MRTRELDRIRDGIRWSVDRGVHYVLATVVDVRGSTYRGLAARQLLRADQTSVGTISGGCLDGDLWAAAREVLETGTPRLVEFDLTSDSEAVWGWGVGCYGSHEVLVEPAATALPVIERLATSTQEGQLLAVIHHLGERSLGVRTYVSSEFESSDELMRRLVNSATTARRHSLLDIGGERVMIEVVERRPRLLVCGAGNDAVPLVEQATHLGFDVTVVLHRESGVGVGNFRADTRIVKVDANEVGQVFDPDCDTYAVLMSHNYLWDLDCLDSLLGTDIAYIGTIGPGDRLDRLVDDLVERGRALDDIDFDRIYGPAGLDIGADGPEEIAWSIVAEVLAVRRGRNGGMLRVSKGSRHRRGTPAAS